MKKTTYDKMIELLHELVIKELWNIEENKYCRPCNSTLQEAVKILLELNVIRREEIA